MRHLVPFFLLAGLLYADPPVVTNPVNTSHLKVWVDRDLYEVLPDKYLFENITSKLFHRII